MQAHKIIQDQPQPKQWRKAPFHASGQLLGNKYMEELVVALVELALNECGDGSAGVPVDVLVEHINSGEKEGFLPHQQRWIQYCLEIEQYEAALGEFRLLNLCSLFLYGVFNKDKRPQPPRIPMPPEGRLYGNPKLLIGWIQWLVDNQLLEVTYRPFDLNTAFPFYVSASHNLLVFMTNPGIWERDPRLNLYR